MVNKASSWLFWYVIFILVLPVQGEALMTLGGKTSSLLHVLVVFRGVL